MAKEGNSQPSAHPPPPDQQGEADDEKDKKHEKRPGNTAFRQQRLKAWQPILTPMAVIPVLFIIGILFTPVGGLLYYVNTRVSEIVIDYSHCASDSPQSPSWADIPTDRVSKLFKPSNYGPGTPAAWQHQNTSVSYYGVPTNTTICSLQFDILNELAPPVLLYYRLTNFYQNHRRYVTSVDLTQLKGDAKTASQLSSDCDPIRAPNGSAVPYYPCGLIANSYFNDTFSSPVLTNTQNSSSDSMTYLMSDKGIAWSSDAKMFGATSYKVGEAIPPPNWQLRYPHGYTNETGFPNLHDDESFQVWMRTAGLPSFSKLARRNATSAMSPGRYRVDIRDYFPATEYGGTKSIVITTESVLGGRNPALSIVYFVTGGLCLFLGTVFLILRSMGTRTIGDHSYVVFETGAPAGGATSGSGAPAHGVVSATGRKI